MERAAIILGLFLVLLLGGCISSEGDSYEGNVGSFCLRGSDCNTPMEYLVQSNCPFGSACIERRCAVVCPMFHHDPNLEISKSYPDACEVDSDCDCSWRGNRTINCLCLEGGCYSVEAE